MLKNRGRTIKNQNIKNVVKDFESCYQGAFLTALINNTFPDAGLNRSRISNFACKCRGCCGCRGCEINKATFSHPAFEVPVCG